MTWCASLLLLAVVILAVAALLGGIAVSYLWNTVVALEQDIERLRAATRRGDRG